MGLSKSLYNRFLRPKTTFYKYLVQILGFHPGNLSFYELAFKHKSVHKENNERLEFLGDTILDSVISKELYHKYPQKKEGELSKLRSKAVNRTFLNDIGKKLNLDKHLDYNLKSIAIEETNMMGNAFESLIGAIYLDGGYVLVEKYLSSQIFEKHIKWSEIDSKTLDFKSKLLQNAQKTGNSVVFEILSEFENEQNKRIFEVGINIDSEFIASAKGSSKKKAEQRAAENALALLN